MGVISSDERKVGLHQRSEYLHKEVLTVLNRRLPRHDTPFAFTRIVLTRTIVKPLIRRLFPTPENSPVISCDVKTRRHPAPDSAPSPLRGRKSEGTGSPSKAC